MTEPNLNRYVKEVIGKPRQELISTDKKGSDGKPDDQANKSATLNNFEEEVERLSILAAEQSSCTVLTNDCKKIIKASRKSLSDTNFKIDDVLDNLDDLKRRLIRAHESRILWPKVFVRILLGNVFWIGLFIGIIIWQSLIPATGSSGSMAMGILACAIWGGVGGVVDAAVSLISHFTIQDFDKQFEPWYYLHPFLGMSLGAIIYLVFQAGLATISNSNTTPGGGTTTLQVGVNALSITIAFLAGFKQTSAINFLIRIVKSVFEKEESSTQKSS